MSTGIGSSVKRKEDKRFTTGKGRYTDDVRNDNQAYAAFVRSPHAHASVKGIDASAALAMDGVIDVLNGAQLTGDAIGNIICGWAITSKDGTPMKMGAWSALATEKVRYVGDAVAVVVAETQAQARIAAEAVEVEYEEL
ncbi:MAG: xanthine dehydrogenase family protein molybdopterin-binding subunit, partial [Rhodobacteraceae bacterium]|nr:xanthine dehydrogenase family protein molybdopterin-binding subunit [Paracoccaceae bacterium]